MAPLGGINLHGSLLPRHRGAAPVQWAILAGDTATGVSVIRMTPALDAGGVIVVRSTPIVPRETAVELEERLAVLGAEAVLEAVDRLQAGHDEAVPQDANLVTRAPRLTKAAGIVDWSQPASVIERMRRALEPWPRIATFFHRGGRSQRLVLEEVAVGAAPAPAGVAPGTVLAVDERGIVVACGGGTSLVVSQVVPEGKRGMTAAAFCRGNAIHPGTVLG
jgi:methionyl-tRNA formyltransferase